MTQYKIKGKVHDSNNNPIPNLIINAFDRDPRLGESSRDFLGGTESDLSGYFEISISWSGFSGSQFSESSHSFSQSSFSPTSFSTPESQESIIENSGMNYEPEVFLVIDDPEGKFSAVRGMEEDYGKGTDRNGNTQWTSPSIKNLSEIDQYDITVLTSAEQILLDHNSVTNNQKSQEADSISSLEKGSENSARSVEETARTEQDRVKVEYYVPTHSDRPAKEDRLGRKPLALVLANIIDGMRAGGGELGYSGPFLINVHGPWGSGKTTLLDFTSDQLKSKKTPWLIVNINAWEYQRLGSPPWWSIMDNIFRKSVSYFNNKARWKSLEIRFWEYRWRLLTGRSNWFWGIALFLGFLAASVFFLSGKTPVTDANSGVQIFDFLDNKVAALIALAGSLISGITAIRNSLIPGSVKVARDFLQQSSDPTRRLADHFEKLINKISNPVAVFIDDMDRCKDTYVVEFLEGIQTIFRNVNVTYIIAADQRWIFASYEKAYENFIKAIDEPGRPLGYLFMDKIFQLMVPLPRLSPTDQERYLRNLLLTPSELENEEKMINKADNHLKDLNDPEKILDLINSQANDTEYNRVVRQRAVLKLEDRDLQKKTEHFLQPFCHLLEPNPRSIIRFVNIFKIVRAVDILSATKTNNNKLALWTILALRWPRLARYLTQNPEMVENIGKKIELTQFKIPDNLEDLFKNQTVSNVVNCKDPPITIDANTISKITLWST